MKHLKINKTKLTATEIFNYCKQLFEVSMHKKIKVSAKDKQSIINEIVFLIETN